MRRLSFTFFLAACLVGHAVSAQEPTAQRARDYRIRLETATFDPAVRMRTDAGKASATAPLRTDWYIVQFVRIPTEGERKALQQKYRLQLTQYIPNYAYLEKVPLTTLADLIADPLYRAHVPYAPEFKIAPDIGTERVWPPDAPVIDGIRITVVLFADGDPESVAKAAPRGRDVEIVDERKLGGALKVYLTVPSMAEVRAISLLPAVRWIEETLPINEDNGNTAGRIQSGTIGVTPIWNAGIHGEGQIVGVSDSGVTDLNHCAFMDNSDNTVRPAHRKVVGIRPAGAGLGSGHGNFVAATVAGAPTRAAATPASRLPNGDMPAKAME